LIVDRVPGMNPKTETIMETATTILTLEEAIEWVESTQYRWGREQSSRGEIHLSRGQARNQPAHSMSLSVSCAPTKHREDRSPEEDADYHKHHARCVRLSIAVEWGGKTHEGEAIIGARVRVYAVDWRVGSSCVASRCQGFVCGFVGAGELKRDLGDIGFVVERLGDLQSTIIAWVEERGPLDPPSSSELAQRQDLETCSHTADEVATENAITRFPDGKRPIRIKSRGLTYCADLVTKSDMVGMIQEHAKLIYDQPAISFEGGYVGTWRGGRLREVCFEVDDRRMYCYVLHSTGVDDWAEECWTTDHRLTAEAAFDTIRATRERPVA
jgi:hypothetical protein